MLKATAIARSRASTIGWIGLGAMGHPMALNLFTKTYLAHQSQSGNTRIQSPKYTICEQDEGRVSSFLSELREKGGSELASSVERVGNGREMAKAASRIITMLPSTPQVESVYLDGTDGILPGLLALSDDTPSLTSSSPSSSPRSQEIKEGGSESVQRVSSSTTYSSGLSSGKTPLIDSSITITPPSSSASTSAGAIGAHTLLVDCTTLSPTSATSIAQRIHQETLSRVFMLDAPVSGGTVAAKKGELTIMFGSPSAAATGLAVPLLKTMAKGDRVVYCGGNGKGVGVKVCNNLILAINQIALAEGLALGESLGIDPVLLHDVINTSSGQSWSSRVNPPLKEIDGSPASRDYAGGFQSRLMLKDAGLALEAAAVLDLPIPMTWAAKSIYEAVCRESEGEWATKDFSVVYEWIKKKQLEGVERGWKADPTET
ncbi:uncharacterized protein I303_101059 [Kwoniella dejecticola CBS 10117]|uniref:3-hydroxyisobutyrate dehydrogenase n=1 Tax=Kwoniella dejecticola CBS 10117 TaxID=1296121 RepID=A0A1A6AGQ1_9TREE|nr:uncharacterized protein I303_01062 [Kwoniella dejecticola CBS 10117]OBR89237.1 hypothetical protein I303_01062 [Kwoniella dejecticola CBS 10117]